MQLEPMKKRISHDTTEVISLEMRTAPEFAAVVDGGRDLSRPEILVFVESIDGVRGQISRVADLARTLDMKVVLALTAAAPAN